MLPFFVPKYTKQQKKNGGNSVTVPNQLTLGSLFDGVGVFPLAGRLHDIKTLWASEILKVPVSITKRHFPDMLHVGDLTKLSGATLPFVDIITFGSPCQNLSTIGSRTGLAGESSSLFYEAIRIIKEMRHASFGRYPTFAIWENVAGAFSSNDGLDFAKVLSIIADTEIPMPTTGRWAKAGMVCGRNPQIAWRLLDSQYFAVPQRRKRIFLMADFTGERAAQILFNPTPFKQDFDYVYEGTLQSTSRNSRGLSQTGSNPYRIYPMQFRRMRSALQYQNRRSFRAAFGRMDDPSPTLLASGQQALVIHNVEDDSGDHVRYLTPTECERLMGLPEDWTKYGEQGGEISDSARYHALGNSIALPCASYIFASMQDVLTKE